MKTLYDLPAPAKLNLFLHITGRRDDGYHLLQSVFMLIDWADTLHVELRRDGGLSREDLTSPLPEDDLILRAARALQKFARPGLGAHIAIDKQIPAQAGMGGGSSDAATCLLALNRLWDLRLPRSTLAAIGLSLGADVPFFIGGRHAWVEGIGERMTPVDLPSARFIVVKPTAGIDTRSIFMASDLERATPAAILSGFAAGHIDQTYEFGHNDLQPVAQRLCPEVSEAIRWLGDQGFKARMTGSGSAVFALMNTPPGSIEDNTWHETASAIPPVGWQVRECSNLDIHPLAGWVD
ncbi:MAG: 4-(cytidine 5'-diphospho)-2-C-methyl-D-erythritol kinase [Variovorax sp.]|jgi:4-diphosphocytidyl-2-C-methyl-D-erythritol kinase|nr:MAG: 4-(cytidine 5'-diphospho)-2-C-methyl-D-erythritol kinase [Variovorax sp.]